MGFSKIYMNRLIVLITVGMLLTACGNESKEVKSASQVVAKVNGDEISIHQVNFQLSRLGPIKEEQAKKASQKVLEKLVNIQLLKQKAIEEKLDRDPNVLQAIEAAKSQLLAQAYMQKVMAGRVEPNASEIDSFYSEHPELFQDRRVFNLQELVVVDGAKSVQLIEETVNKNPNLSAVAEWLKSSGYKFSLSANVRAAEQLPTKLLAELKSRSDGDMLTVINGESVNVISIAGSEMQPISKEKAAPIIQKYFENKSKKEKMKLNIDVLKKSAEIQYLGEFANNEADMTDTEVLDEAKQQKQGAESTENLDQSQSAIEEGLSGF